MTTHSLLRPDTQVQPAGSSLLAQATAVSPVGLCLVTTDRRIRYANDKAASLLRLQRNASNGEPWRAAPAMTGFFNGSESLFQRVLHTHQPATNPWQKVEWGPNESIVLCTQANPLLDEQQKLLGIAFYCLDVTVPCASSMRALHMHIEKEHQSHLKSLTQVANGMALTFNTLLASIIGESEAALDATSNPQRSSQEHIRRALRSAYKAAGVSKQLLSFSAKERLAVAPKQPSELLFSFRDQLEGLLRPGTELHWELARDIPTISVDQVKLKQALTHLVMNSVQATPSLQGGGIRIRTSTQFVDADNLRRIAQRSASAKPGRYVIIEVVDQGQGVEPSVQKRMFDPFFSTRPPQAGLGLPAAAGMARAHGGFLAVDSRPGQGTTMRLGLPAHEQAAQSSGKRRSPSADPTPKTMQVGVLVVDDEPTVRNVAAMLLTRASATTFVAGDGESALQLYSSEQDRIDVALVDMTMPGMNGVEVLAKLREHNEQLPIVLMSGFSGDRSYKPDAITQFLPKPFSREQMFTSIRTVLGRNQQPAGC